MFIKILGGWKLRFVVRTLVLLLTEVCSEDFSPSFYLTIEQSSKYSRKVVPLPVPTH